jgi:hypothetical protein
VLSHLNVLPALTLRPSLIEFREVLNAVDFSFYLKRSPSQAADFDNSATGHRWLNGGKLIVRSGSEADLTAPKSDFRFAPDSGLNADIAACPKGAMNGLMRCNKP